jgi:predicted amidohydrolase
VAALDVVLLLRLAKWPAGASRAAWALLATAAAITAANVLIAAGQVGQQFGLRPWESALKMGPSYAWLLTTLALDPVDLALCAAALLLALWMGLSGPRPAPSAR